MASNKLGRPRIDIDGDLVRKLANFHCTLIEMADFFNVSTDTLRDNYSTFIAKGRAEGKMKLRKKQFELATNGKGNPTMLIWLGKQMLGQADHTEGEENMPLPITDIL